MSDTTHNCQTCFKSKSFAVKSEERSASYGGCRCTGCAESRTEASGTLLTGWLSASCAGKHTPLAPKGRGGPRAFPLVGHGLRAKGTFQGIVSRSPTLAQGGRLP